MSTSNAEYILEPRYLGHGGGVKAQSDRGARAQPLARLLPNTPYVGLTPADDNSGGTACPRLIYSS
jgi:hypothetical protein